MGKKVKILYTVLTFVVIICNISINFANNVETQDHRNEVLIVTKIIEDGGNLDKEVTRGEFAKIITRASDKREKVTNFINESVCADVNEFTPYAPYIKNVLDDGHMFMYLGGYFKPNDNVIFSDLTRACLSLLAYDNSDFVGNQVKGRNLKFIALGLNENIDKNENDIITKKDIINAVYNTLKEFKKNSSTPYGKTIFENMEIGNDGEINVWNLMETKVDGPIYIRKQDELNFPFEVTDNNLYINGINNTLDDLKSDIDNYGYTIIYIDNNKKNIYAYTERVDIVSPVFLKTGYITDIHYSAENLTIPYRVDISYNKYYIENEEMKFAFSADGAFKIDDRVIYICNKMHDVTSEYIDSSGKKKSYNEETEPYNGSIVNVFKYDEIFK